MNQNPTEDQAAPEIDINIANQSPGVQNIAPGRGDERASIGQPVRR